MTQNPSPIRVMLAEDHRALREGLRMLLEVEGDIKVVAESEGGKEVITLALEQRPDVILMDVALLGLDGIEATRKIHAQAPELAVVMLSAHLELHIVRAALDAGALGYVLKRAGGKELRDAVRAARQGQPFFSAEILTVVRERARIPAGIDPALAEDAAAALTRREVEILQLIAIGRSNREIAEILQLSVKTVETHRLHLMEKLDIHDVATLTRYAIRKGLVDVC